MNIKIREPGSALTHLVAALLAAGASLPLLIKAGTEGGAFCVFAMFIFALSTILLFAASTTYHTVNLAPKFIKIFRKVDHMMIFVMIAGSYTPVCLLILPKKIGLTMLIAVWSIAIGGMILKACWITCPKWFSSILYIAMGWICLGSIRPLWELLSRPAFLWLLAGGLIYTVGGIIYALKLGNFNSKHAFFSSHVIFHIFIMAGSLCHFIFMYSYVA